MNFVQVQEITMPENVGYITELIADFYYRGLGHTISGDNWGEFVHVLFSTEPSEECALVNSFYCASW